MKFVYQAKTKKGTATTGEVEAENKEAALRELMARDLVVVSVEVEKKRHDITLLTHVSVFERVIFTKHLGIMLKAGVALDEALRIAEVSNKGALRGIIAKVRRDVESGERLANALARHPRAFSEYYVNMVKAGEESGNLAENLEQLAIRFSKDFDLRQKALSAMLYPTLVVALTIGLGVIVAFFVLPRLSALFSAFDFELPLSTRILIWMSHVSADYGVWIAGIALVLFVLFVIVVRLKVSRPAVDTALLHLPVIKKITRTLNLARFCNILASLLKSGLPINHALAVTEQVVGNVKFKRAIHEAIARVDRGETLSVALSGHQQLFPPFVHRMIQIGDETGKTEDVLFYLAEFYENDLDVTLKNLSTVIEPALLVSIGALVAILALSIITPIYGFISAIG
ncbi:MAG: type II secretion system F family protein [Patescibacteria group bacterium]